MGQCGREYACWMTDADYLTKSFLFASCPPSCQLPAATSDVCLLGSSPPLPPGHPLEMPKKKKERGPARNRQPTHCNQRCHAIWHLACFCFPVPASPPPPYPLYPLYTLLRVSLAKLVPACPLRTAPAATKVVTRRSVTHSSPTFFPFPPLDPTSRCSFTFAQS